MMLEPKLMSPTGALNIMQDIMRSWKGKQQIYSFITELERKCDMEKNFCLKFVDNLWKGKVITVKAQREALDECLQKCTVSQFAYDMFQLVDANIGQTSAALRRFVKLLLFNEFKDLAELLDPDYVEYFENASQDDLSSLKLQLDPNCKEFLLPGPTTPQSIEQFDGIFRKNCHDLDSQNPLPKRSEWPSSNFAKDLGLFLKRSEHKVRKRMRNGYCYNTKWKVSGPDNQLHGGLCVIININSYKQSNLDREGSLQDFEFARCLFEQKFGMVVLAYHDVDVEGYNEAFNDIMNVNNVSSFPCLVIFIMCHGDEEYLYLRNARLYGNKWEPDDRLSIKQDVRDRVGSLQPFLGKPKIVFIQACQGAGKSYVLSAPENDLAAPENTVRTRQNDRTDSFENGSSQSNESGFNSDSVQMDPRLQWEIGDSCKDKDVFDGPQERVPVNADMAMIRATAGPYPAMRNTEYGTVFIQALLEVLKRRAHYQPLHYIMQDVHQLMLTYSNRHYQVPSIFQTLKQDFYFYCEKDKHST